MYTLLADVVVPEIWAPYFRQLSLDKFTLLQNGVVRRDAQLDGFTEGGGSTIHVPFYTPLPQTDSQVMLSDTEIAVNKIGTETAVAVKQIRANAWGAEELAGALAGSDPMEAIGAQVGHYWSVDMQRRILAILAGLFGTGGALQASHMNDVSGKAGDAGLLTPSTVLDTKQKLGDNANIVDKMFINSLTFTNMQKRNEIETIVESDTKTTINRYIGLYDVVVDDGIPVDNGVTTSFILAEGCIGLGSGDPTSLTEVELAREALKSKGALINRNANTLHVYGTSWEGAKSIYNPTNAQLSTATNWKKVYDDKAIGVLALKHKVE